MRPKKWGSMISFLSIAVAIAAVASERRMEK
jgi:hypothetical protein